MNFAPFYIGQTVVAVDAITGSSIKNGQKYIVNSCDYAQSGNPLSKGAYYWYVGVQGYHNRLRPTIFAPINEDFISISLDKVIENEFKYISSN